MKVFNKNKCDILSLNFIFEKVMDWKEEKTRLSLFSLLPSPTSIPLVFKHKFTQSPKYNVGQDINYDVLHEYRPSILVKIVFSVLLPQNWKFTMAEFFFVNFGEKWVRFETKEKKSLKFHFIWDFWWPILETKRFVPYLGELKRD